MSDEILGQILPDSLFGQLLTRLAEKSETIVEIGTWRGMGSTKCLANGLVRESQRFITIDSGLDKIQEASKRYSDSRITFLHGTCCYSSAMLPPTHPDKEMVKYYEGERLALSSAPIVINQLPDPIDLLLLDGGEWSSYGEFMILKDIAKVIALDDANQAKAQKNWQARSTMIADGWRVLVDMPEERNGIFIAEKPQ